MADDLKVRMGVDVDGVLRGMERAGKSLQDFKDQAARFKDALDKAADPKSIERLNKAIEASSSKIRLIQQAGLKAGDGFNKMSAGANTAGQSLTNLGRIAQDAPFGFIGIQNNINPLLESFQRLQVESKATGTSVKDNLIKALAGGAGLGLAVSVVTGLLTVFASKLNFSSAEVDKFAESFKALKKEIKDVEERLKDVADQAEYMQRLNDINLKINFSDETVSTRASQQAGILDNMQREVDLNKERSAAYDRLNASFAKYQKNISKSASFAIGGKNVGSLDEDFIEKLKKSDQSLIKMVQAAEKALADIDEKILKNKQEFGIKKQGLALFEIETERKKQEELKKLAKKERQGPTISSTLEELSREIDFLNAKQIAFGTNEAKAKISAIERAVEKLIKDFKVAPDDAIINKLFYGGTVKNEVKGFNIPGIEGLKKNLEERVQKTISGPPMEITVPVLPKIELKPIDVGLFAKQLRALKIQEGIEALAAELQSIIATNFGDAIAGAFEGKSAGNIFGSFFKNILSALGDGIQQIGVQTLLAGKAIAALRKVFGSSAGIAASIGLIALGGVIKGLANKIKIPGFADGVTNFSGGLAMVGERGPEMVRLPRGSDVVPNHSLGAIGGGQAIEVIVTGQISGQNILLAGRRAQNSYNRST